MNEFDRDNFIFFTTVSDQDFNDWCDQASDEEMVYAMRLIQQGKRELWEQECMLMDEVESTDQAAQLLKQFTLGK